MNLNVTDAARSNLAAVERRALELDGDANQLRDDVTPPDRVRQNANTASMVSAVAWLTARSGRAADAGAGLAAAERAYSYARLAILRPYARYGLPFLEASKRPRTDALAQLIDAALATLPARATASQVLERMVEIDRGRRGRIIQEVDRDDPAQPIIYWRIGRRERTTTFKALQNRLAGRRKK